MSSLCYKKLFKLLIDKDMKKNQLCQGAHISTSTMARLKNGENVNTEILVKICDYLKCDIADICQIERQGEKRA